MIGKVDNGDTADVVFGQYRGQAGVRRLDDSNLVVAFMGEKPYPFPLTGTVDGQSAVASSARPSSVKGMTVLTVRLTA